MGCAEPLTPLSHFMFRHIRDGHEHGGWRSRRVGWRSRESIQVVLERDSECVLHPLAKRPPAPIRLWRLRKQGYLIAHELFEALVKLPVASFDRRHGWCRGWAPRRCHLDLCDHARAAAALLCTAPVNAPAVRLSRRLVSVDERDGGRPGAIRRGEVRRGS